MSKEQIEGDNFIEVVAELFTPRQIYILAECEALTEEEQILALKLQQKKAA